MSKDLIDEAKKLGATELETEDWEELTEQAPEGFATFDQVGDMIRGVFSGTVQMGRRPDGSPANAYLFLLTGAEGVLLAAQDSDGRTVDLSLDESMGRYIGVWSSYMLDRAMSGVLPGETIRIELKGEKRLPRGKSLNIFSVSRQKQRGVPMGTQRELALPRSGTRN